MNEISGYVVFTDLKGFSNMNEPETFYEHTVRPLAKKIKEYRHKAEVWNTWGDALVAVFKKGTDALELMVEYRDYFRKNKLLGLQPRIAGHYGVMKIYNDPMINNMENVLGETVNTAARIEPITFPGEIYVSAKFYDEIVEEKKKAIDREKERYSQFEFTPLGEWEMAKNYGTINLYRVFHISEESWNINSLFVKNKNENIDILFGSLSIDDKLQEAKKHEKIKEARQLQTKQDVLDHILENFPKLFDEDKKTLRDDLTRHIKNPSEQNKITGPFLIVMAELFRDIGEYHHAIKCIEAAQEWEMLAVPEGDASSSNERKTKESQKKKYWIESMKGVTLFPFKENTSILKLEADIRSKRAADNRTKNDACKKQDSKQAKNILTKLLQHNPNDTDIMTKLAAQLKREAFQIKSEPIKLDLNKHDVCEWDTCELNSCELLPRETESIELDSIEPVFAETVSNKKDEEKRKEEKWKTLLNEAKYLYLEAFRKNRDYYPAINAAYIFKILRDSNGWHLANYIFNTWKHDTGKNWWLDSTLAETQLLLGEFKFCYQRMERAVKKHNPPFFERHATRDQIEMFIGILNEDESVKDLSLDEQRYAALLSILLQDPLFITVESKKDILEASEDQIEEMKNRILKSEETKELDAVK